jgi:hypothetical protein
VGQYNLTLRNIWEKEVLQECHDGLDNFYTMRVRPRMIDIKSLRCRGLQAQLDAKLRRAFSLQSSSPRESKIYTASSMHDISLVILSHGLTVLDEYSGSFQRAALCIAGSLPCSKDILSFVVVSRTMSNLF